MGKIAFIKGQGGIPVSLPGKDHVSSILMFSGTLPAGFADDNRIIKVSDIEQAKALGITSDAAAWEHKALHFHLKEAFRFNPGIEIYVGLFTAPVGAYDFAELKQMQQFAGGDIRQAAVYCPEKALAADEISALQTVATALEADDMPLSILYAANVASVAALTDLTSGGRQNVSVVIGQDGGETAMALYTEGSKSLTCLGLVLGMVSKARVHESISWVLEFPSGIDVPAFADGSLVRDTEKSVMFGSGSLDEKRFIFLRTHTGIAGSYINDSHNLDLLTSDYNYIERMRTMDKAIRNIRANLLPYLSGPVRIDPESGKLAPDTVVFLEKLAGRALEDMEKAGELSGYRVVVNPDQNVLSTSNIEFVIQNVPNGISRNMTVKIGYTTKLS